jgi:surface antigen
MSYESPEPMPELPGIDPTVPQISTVAVERRPQWRAKAARLLAVAALMTSGMVVAEAVHPVSASADADTYSWSGATTLDEATDDYGYSTCPSNDPVCKSYSGLLYTVGGTTYGEADPWGYALRNCTSFVAEKISQEFNGLSIAGWGNAANWATAAADAGYSVYPHGDSYTPQVGDIATWGSEVGGGYGHVAYVASVSDGVATFDEYNVAETGAYTDTYTSADHPGGQVYPDDYIHIGTLAGGGSGGDVQMIMGGDGTVFAKDSVGDGGWNQETGSGEAAIAAGNDGLQMILGSGGDVWAKSSIGNGGWTEEVSSGIAAIAAGDDNEQMILDDSGDVWAKTGVGYGGWTEETGTGEAAIAIGDDDVQMIMGGDGTVFAKDSIGDGGWTQETGSGEAGIAAGGDGIQMIIGGDGTVFAKTGINYGGWNQETGSGEAAMAAGGAGLQVIMGSGGDVWAKDSIGDGGWTEETGTGEASIDAGG